MDYQAYQQQGGYWKIEGKIIFSVMNITWQFAEISKKAKNLIHKCPGFRKVQQHTDCYEHSAQKNKPFGSGHMDHKFS